MFWSIGTRSKARLSPSSSPCLSPFLPLVSCAADSVSSRARSLWCPPGNPHSNTLLRRYRRLAVYVVFTCHDEPKAAGFESNSSPSAMIVAEQLPMTDRNAAITANGIVFRSGSHIFSPTQEAVEQSFASYRPSKDEGYGSVWDAVCSGWFRCLELLSSGAVRCWATRCFLSCSFVCFSSLFRGGSGCLWLFCIDVDIDWRCRIPLGYYTHNRGIIRTSMRTCNNPDTQGRQEIQYGPLSSGHYIRQKSHSQPSREKDTHSTPHRLKRSKGRFA